MKNCSFCVLLPVSGLPGLVIPKLFASPEAPFQNCLRSPLCHRQKSQRYPFSLPLPGVYVFPNKSPIPPK